MIAPLGSAGRARGVGLEGLRVRCELGRILEAGARVARRRVSEPARRDGPERDAVRHRRCLRHVDRVGVHLGLDEDRMAFRVLQDEPERIPGEARVDRDRNRAGSHGAEEDLEELDAIADDHAHALAGAHTESAHESGDAVRALVELGIGDKALAAAVEIDDGDFVGKARDRPGEEVAQVVAAAIHRPSLRTAARRRDTRRSSTRRPGPRRRSCRRTPCRGRYARTPARRSRSSRSECRRS